jgi:lipid A disaccharide synthetase
MKTYSFTPEQVQLMKELLGTHFRLFPSSRPKEVKELLEMFIRTSEVQPTEEEMFHPICDY